MELKQKTSLEWDALEKEKKQLIQDLQSRKALVEARRADLLLLKAELPDDKTVAKDLENVDKSRKDLSLEIEAVEALLAAIPERRNFAKARELEQQIKDIQALYRQLEEDAAGIDAAADEFVKQVKRYDDTRRELGEINPDALNFRTAHIPAIESIAAKLKEHDLGFVKIQALERYNKTMSANLNTTHEGRTIPTILQRMQDYAKRLRGQGTGERDYCIHCFGNLVFPDTFGPFQGKRRCSKCGELDE